MLVTAQKQGVATRSTLRRIFASITLVVLIQAAATVVSFYDSVSSHHRPTLWKRPLGHIFDPEELAMGRMGRSTLILYSYYEPKSESERSPESNTDSGLARRNLEFFVRYGVLGQHAPNSQQATIVFIIHGGHTSVALPENYSHVHVLRRENVGLEFCGYAEALDKYQNGTHRLFLFLNSSVRGPFLPTYLPLVVPWNFLFEQFLDDPAVKLFGVSINCLCCKEVEKKCEVCSEAGGLEKLHVQSFFFGTDEIGLEVIKPTLRCHNSRSQAILESEIGMSRSILQAGYNLAALDKFWFRHDFNNRNLTERMCRSVAEFSVPHRGDTHFESAYFGMDHHPFESLFIKTNRWKSQSIELYTQWSTPTNSRELCGSVDEVKCSK